MDKKSITPVDTELPLPWQLFRQYIYVFSAITFGSYVVAVGLVWWSAWGSIGWREILFTILILVQIGLYVVVLLPVKRYLTRTDYWIYFGGSIAIWVVGVLLIPESFWLGYAYIGQMFGMLPALPAILGSVFVSGVMIVFGVIPSTENLDTNSVIGLVAANAGMIMFLVFINHLIRTSLERGRLITGLEIAQKELETARENEAELAVYRERERLARDLHDSLGHTLVSLSVQLEAVQRLYRIDPDRASAQVDELKTVTRSSMEELRRTIAGLRSPGLGDRSLWEALQTICVDFGERTGVETTLHLGDCVDRLRPAYAETIWRVVQEALTNVEKHADAKRVQLALICERGSVTLQIQDDGVGVPRDSEMAPDQFGIRGMRERVEGLGGSLNIINTGPGTQIDASLPVVFEPEQTLIIN